MAENGNGNGNGNTIKLNTAILIWLGGLSLCGVFYAGISIEKLTNLADKQRDDKAELTKKFELIELRLENDSANIKAITLSLTRGEKDLLIKPSLPKLQTQ